MHILSRLCAQGGIFGGLNGGGAQRKGTWLTNWGTYITITDSHWYGVSPWGTTVQTVVSLSNDMAIVKNPSTDACECFCRRS